MRYAIGIDLGGTQIKALSATEEGDVLATTARETGDISGADIWTERVREAVLELQHRQGGEPAAIGLSAPGLAAPGGRSIAFMPGRLQGLENLDWTDFLRASTVVAVLNDAHAALLGEIWRGAAAPAAAALGSGSGADPWRGSIRNAILLTLGTGVGGAALVDGKLFRGHIGRGGHFGHISLDPGGPPDVTGCPGSLEDAIGECTLARRSDGAFTSTRELVDAHRRGDARAGRIWLRSVRDLAAGLAGLINVFDPEVAIVGGGIAQAGRDLFEPLANRLDEIEWRPGGHRVPIVPARLGDGAGALGAAYHGLQAKRTT